MLPPYTFPTPSIELVEQALSKDSLRVSEERVGVLKRERARLSAALRDVPQVVQVYPERRQLHSRARRATAKRSARRRAARTSSCARSTIRCSQDCVRITVGRPADNDQLLQAVAGAEREEPCVKSCSWIATARSSRSGKSLADPVEQPLVAGVIPALLRLKSAGYRVRDRHESARARRRRRIRARRSSAPTQRLLALFASQGIRFRGNFVCPHLPEAALRLPQARDRARSRLRERGAARPRALRRWSAIATRTSSSRAISAFRASSSAHRAPRPGTRSRTRSSIGRAAASCSGAHARPTFASTVDLDSEAEPRAKTGLGFFDHMLEQLGKHGGFKLDVQCAGDLHIDEHHTVEDVALDARPGAARSARRQARHSALRVPAADGRSGRRSVRSTSAAGRSSCSRPSFARDRVGDLPTELVPHFFRSLAETLGAAIHVRVRGENTHHMVEVCFKAVARALRQAFERQGDELPTTKGQL